MRGSRIIHPSGAHRLQKAYLPMSIYGRDRSSDSPMAVDIDGGMTPPARMRAPRSWVGMSGYLLAGIFLGLLVIVALSFGRSDAAAAATSPFAITDNVVHLHARDIGVTCWAGYERLGPARVTVALEVGLDGKIRYVAASGETPTMRSCVEAHVMSWEFLPQQQAQTMALPFEIDRR
jgi:hypothetical protein